MQTPDSSMLEQLSDEEFWDLAFSRAFPSPSLLTSPAFSVAHSSQRLPDATDASLSTSSSDDVYVLCDETYAFPLATLYEIISLPHHFALLPGTPPWMMGLISWRGHILAAIDLPAYLMGMSEAPEAQPGLSMSTARSLLIAHHESDILAFAANPGDTLTRYEQFQERVDAMLLDVAALFHDIIQQLERKRAYE